MEKKYDDNITNNMLALLTVKSEDEINRLFNKIQEIEYLTGRKLDKEKFTAIHTHRQYNIPSHGRDKSLVSRNVLSNKRRAKVSKKPIKNKKKKTAKTKKKSEVITINSEDSSENDCKESSSINKLEYQERILAIKERELALREREAKVHSIELENLEKEQKLKSAS
ncbi:19670_t:CDS:2 [Racocetra fulgida]|uniref:19670_t:CDS:1 n=1 Tax=Racocetra fulgida TaxID=60492 RepID=A0A9N8VQH9_9GLOM|nr:19670_t:CDS:2 [Racocetra fulgida]